MTSIINLRCEYRVQPLGIDVTAPRLSWQMQTNRRGARQTAYRILAASQPTHISEDNCDVWDSGRIESDQSIHIVYQGHSLKSRQRVYWKVIVWDETGQSTESELTWFEMGLLDRRDWQAQWIGGDLIGGPRSPIPAPYVRKRFHLPDEIQSARLYITAMGLFECSINGQVIGDAVLFPGWTDFNTRIRYIVYDITGTLQSGENVIGAVLGDGWAVGHISNNDRQQYTDRPRLIAQLEITLKDGRTECVVTDGSWMYHYGPLLDNDLIMGESYDARLEMPGWNEPGFSANDWRNVMVFEDTCAVLVANNGPAIKRIEELHPVAEPVAIGNGDKPRYIFDLGQNMVGRVRMKANAPVGTTVILRFAEMLNPDGTLYTTNLRTARVTDHYTFKGEGEEIWEPKFTFHGFRYVEVRGLTGEVSRDTITGIVLHSDMAVTGQFECSDPMINQLQHNIRWGQKGNFLDVPTDCPQRDERLGWTGDIQVFLRTAAFNMDVAGFMTKWLQDLLDSQTEEGIVPSIVPIAPDIPPEGGPAWADAIVICPWTLYLTYGDQRILETMYAGMVKFMDFLCQTSPDYIRCAPTYDGWLGYGDWLSINAETPRDLIGTAFFAYDANLMAQIADVLGKTDDAAKYRSLFNAIKAAYGERYLAGSSITSATERSSESHKLKDKWDSISRGNLQIAHHDAVPSEVFNTNLFSPEQTAYVLSLCFDLLPDDLRDVAAAELVTDIQNRNMHLSTGFVGAPYLPHVLSQSSHSETAYSLLFQKTWPSWLYSVTQGATTIWERWDGWTEESGFQSPEMNSFNHYAYGSIGAWLYNTVAGIEIDAAQPGYKHSILRPQPDRRLTKASAKLTTPYGDLISDWHYENGKFYWSIVIPPNTSATVYPPIDKNNTLTVDGKHMDDSVHELDAGTYHFVVE